MAYKFSEIITTTIDDPTDNDKQIIMDLSGATTNTSTTLKFNQTADRILTFPDLTDTIVVSGDYRFVIPQLLIVKNSNAGPGEFTSVLSAVATITDSSAIKPYIVKIGPGIYLESGTINVPTHVSIIGHDVVSCIIIPNGDFNAFNITQASKISTLSISNVSPTKYGIVCENVGQGAIIDKIIFTNTLYPILFTNTDTQSQIAIREIDIVGPATTGITIIDNSGVPLIAQLDRIAMSGHSDNCILLDGSACTIVVQNCTMLSDGCGNFLNVLNGAHCDIYSSELRGLTNGIMTGDNIANFPEIRAGNVLFSDNIKDINIINRTGTGFYNGEVTYNKTIINPFSDFFITGKDRSAIIVSKQDGDFNSVSDAIDAINPEIVITINNLSTNITSLGLFNASLDGVLVTGAGIPASTTATFVDENTMTLSNAATNSASITATFVRATATNKFIISIGPGNYIEPDMQVPDYVSIIGVDQSTVEITPQDISGTLFELGTSSSVKNITVSDVTNGIGILIDSDIDSAIQNVIVNNCNTCIQIGATIAETNLDIIESSIVGNYTYGIYVDGTTLNSVDTISTRCSGLRLKSDNSGAYCYYITGPNTNIFIGNNTVHCQGLLNTTGIYIDDGCDVTVAGTEIDGANIGIHIANNGSGAQAHVVGITIQNSITYDINMEHPGATGIISASAERSKVFVDPASSISIIYSDPVVNGHTLVGSIFLGKTNDTTTDTIELIMQHPAMGLTHGGIITDNSGTTIDVSGGYGYVSTGTIPNHILKKISWNSTSLVLPTYTTSYIYVDSNSLVTSNAARPSTIESILLGRVHTDASGIELIDASPVAAMHMDNAYDNYNRDVFGSIFASGSIVTMDASGLLAISQGKYYFSENVFNPSGQSSPAEYTSYYHDGSGSLITKMDEQTYMDNTQYDSSGNLVPIGNILVSTLSINTTNTSTTITSSGLFTSSLDGYIIAAPGIINNTTATFVDVNTMTLSNPAIDTGTVDASFIVATSSTITITTTSSSNNITSSSAFDSQLIDSQLIATGIPTNTRVIQFNSSSSIDLSNLATASGSVSGVFIVPGRITIGTTNLLTDITSAGLFTSAFVGATVTGTNIPASTTVTVVTDASNATISNAATGTGSISAIFKFTNKATKHSLYLVGDGANEKYMFVYGQTQFADTASALIGDLPIPPNYFTEGVVIIASIVGNLIQSERPRPSFIAGDTGGATIHGNLLGLSADDHQQYLLVNGTRAMAGDLNMGGFSVTNVNLVDGVDVSDHASRHLPNGADPISTAAPITNLTATTSNSAGTANTLIRSDHTHAISTGTPVTQQPDQTNDTGTSVELARANHVHNIPTAAPITQEPDQSNFIGSIFSFARSDHVHNIPTATATDVSNNNTQGSATSFSKSDHTHKGVHSINANAGTQEFGDITLQQGTNISIADASGTMTVSFSGVLPIANGGTNSSSDLSNNRLMISSGGAIIEASALTNGQLFIGSTGAAPVAANLTSTGGTVIITNGAGTINLESSIGSSSIARARNWQFFDGARAENPISPDGTNRVFAVYSFDGTSSADTITALDIVCEGSATTTTATIKIFDRTNVVTIATLSVTGFAVASVFEKKTTASISGLSSGAAIHELQAQRTSSGTFDIRQAIVR